MARAIDERGVCAKAPGKDDIRVVRAAQAAARASLGPAQAPSSGCANVAPYTNPSSSCTSTVSPAATSPTAVPSTMKQFACDIDDRMPEP